MSLTSDEVNLLVFRYLIESGIIAIYTLNSGFNHSAFIFSNESLLSKSTVANQEIAPGALISFLQKGLQYVEIEAHIREDGSLIECNESISVLKEHTCSLREINQPNIEPKSTTPSYMLQKGDVATLEGSQQEITSVAWNISGNVLVSCSRDCTLRFWNIPEGHISESNGIDITNNSIRVALEADDYVNTLQWNNDCSLLVTGHNLGSLRYWDGKGNKIFEIKEQTNAVTTVKFSISGLYTVSGSVDHSLLVYDVKERNTLKKIQYQNKVIVDVDWKDDNTFLACDNEGHILLYNIEISEEPIKIYNAHKEDVNVVRWNPDKTLFASCSDDQTVKIWNEENTNSLYEFHHDSNVYQIDWCKNSKYHNYLASASYDKTVIVWDVDNDGKIIHKFDKHTGLVYSVSWSPSGDYLASGSMDNVLYVWSVKDGSIVEGYDAKYPIYEVAWNKTGNKIALCCSSGIVTVMNVNSQ